MNKKIINKVVVIIVIITLIVWIFYIIGKNEQNNQLNELGFSNSDIKEMKKSVESLTSNYSGDTPDKDELAFLKENQLEFNDSNIFKIKDGDHLPDPIIYFRKHNGEWFWSVMSGVRNDLSSMTYDNPKSIKDGYTIKTEKVKSIFNKLKDF